MPLAAVEVGGYLNVWKLIPVLLILMFWARVLTWIDKDAEAAYLPRDPINASFIGGAIRESSSKEIVAWLREAAESGAPLSVDIVRNPANRSPVLAGGVRTASSCDSPSTLMPRNGSCSRVRSKNAARDVSGNRAIAASISAWASWVSRATTGPGSGAANVSGSG